MLDARMMRAKRWDRLWALWLLIVFILVPAAAWVQHILTSAAAERWMTLILGTVFFPVGVVHGIVIWLGVHF